MNSRLFNGFALGLAVLAASALAPASLEARLWDLDPERLEALDESSLDSLFESERHVTLYASLMSGRTVVPPRHTRAKALIGLVPSRDGERLEYGIAVAFLKNPISAELFLGERGMNGESVATLYSAHPGGGRKFGVLTEGVIRADDLRGPLQGATVIDLLAALEAGNVYAQIATDDGNGRPDTGAGDFPSGEIRGQLNRFGSPFPFPTARLQVIHNAADPAAAVVDIYLNGDLALDDFAFRSATPFLDIPAERQLEIAVAPGNSGSVDEALATIPVILRRGATYVALANGVLDPPSFASNPDGRDTAFQLFVKEQAREAAQDVSKVEFFAVHGATDAPTVDVIARGVATLVDNAAYGDLTDYLAVPPAAYVLDVTPGNDNSTIVASFVADLSGLAGGAATVFATGFLDPSANNNGEAFGLSAALPNGAVVDFPLEVVETPMARLQVIHNAADPGAAVVDIYLNGDLALNDFAFRTATPFLDVPAEEEIEIAVAGPMSSSVGDALAVIPVTLAANETYVALANGVLDPSSFAANPEGRDTAFRLLVKAGAREVAQDVSKVEFFAVHGATDAPTVDVIARGVATLVDNATYGDLTDYLAVPPAAYVLDVTPGNDNSTIVASFLANLSGLAGGAATVFASGFLDPTANQGGAAFGLFAALADGTVVPFSKHPVRSTMLVGDSPRSGSDSARSGISDAAAPRSVREFALAQNRPNPVRRNTLIEFALPSTSDVSLKVFDIRGRLVETVFDGSKPTGIHQVDFDASRLPAGVYYYRIQTVDFADTRKMIVTR